MSNQTYNSVARAEDMREVVEAAIAESERESRAFRWVALLTLILTVAAGMAFVLLGFGIWLLLACAVFTMATCVSAMIGFM